MAFQNYLKDTKDMKSLYWILYCTELRGENARKFISGLSYFRRRRLKRYARRRYRGPEVHSEWEFDFIRGFYRPWFFAAKDWPGYRTQKK